MRQNSFIMKGCSAAEMSWHTSLFLQYWQRDLYNFHIYYHVFNVFRVKIVMQK